MFIIKFALINLIRVISGAMFIRAILSWFVSPYNAFYIALCRLTEPVISPVRSLYNKFGTSIDLPIDIPYLLTFILLEILMGIISRL